MGIFATFEGKMEDTFGGTADKMFDAPSPRSDRQEGRKADAPREDGRRRQSSTRPRSTPCWSTPDDDRRLFGYYPTLAGETETYLAAKAADEGLVMDGQPLVRFIVDDGLKHGKFDVIAEAVAAPIISQLRNEEMQRYGLGGANAGYGAAAAYPAQQFGRAGAAMPDQRFNQYDQYDQYGNQGYQQMPAGNGWEAQGYQAPAREPWDQPAATLITLRRSSRPLPVRSISSTPMPPAPPLQQPLPATPLRRPLPATPQVRWPVQLRDPRPCRSRRRPSRPPTP